jgi:cytochrome c oxidase subunit III
MATPNEISHDMDATTEHGDDHHGDHPSFLAHHFDTPEQQYDSGKLGMWLFLVTEVLFFSGLFCAYVIFRALRPEVFQGCSVFLNTQLGAINTGVLLFSSLTMAWAVRCAQLEEHKKLVGMLTATISCAMLFLGVKAIEYSHKFEMGLLPAGLYSFDPDNVVHHEGVSPYLFWICFPFALLFIGLAVWYVVAAVSRNKFQMRVSGPLTIAAACFFAGVGLGTILESGGSESHASELHGKAHEEGSEAGVADVAHVGDGAAKDHAEESHAAMVTGEDEAASERILDRMEADATNTGVASMRSAGIRQKEVASGRISVAGDEGIGTVAKPEVAFNSPYLAGVFFSIYYCMTGIHAIHILAGIGVLAWLLVRSVRRDFNRQYFGPVDYVGLYWHIVDLIWIYLFPLLYLIR